MIIGILEKSFSDEEGKYILIFNYNNTYYQKKVSILYTGVSPWINIKGGGVHHWYMMFGQQCSIIVIYKTHIYIYIYILVV